MSTLKERSDIAIKCLPASPFKERLKELHSDMLSKICELEFYKNNKTCMGCWGEVHQCGCGLAEQSK